MQKCFFKRIGNRVLIISGPVEPVLLRFQTLLANALAMLQLVHLIVAKKFHHKFNELALAVPVDSSLRPPNLQEDMQTAEQPRPRAHQPPVTPKKIDPKPPPKKTGTPTPVKKDDRLKVLPDTHEALQAWKDVLVGTPFLHNMIPPMQMPIQASADACATEKNAGLGGILRINGQVEYGMTKLMR
ncbi:unnamed protein product [Cladocopium goreaui]|uniref:Reverse transcriptase domain-containing protein n=1 Tax=Cladocopium goreaui TaxID=2562237 RepID=A0A9P1C6R7_9DINO|nr:unnamed protein product [Cladocopium goreaui]